MNKDLSKNELLGKPFSKLSFTDDYIFWKVLTTNIDLCRELLEIILNIKIAHIEYSHPQESIEITSDARGVRLDVYIEGSGTVYNIEMQTAPNRNLPKRTRYYQGMIDLNLIERGADFTELKASYIIFICTFDPFGKGLPVYVFKNICTEIHELVLNDESTKVFVNGDAKNAPERLGEFIRYLSGSITGEFSGKLDNAVENVKLHKEWRREYMTLLMRDAEKRAEGREEGRAEGIKEGCTKGETKFATLTARLLETKRYEELEKATKDMEFRRQLYQELHIED